ncbi:NAD(P)/FAD-dependent oxidoreductase [Candidatus Woesearchaeota archaeon]|nr:NAD(P)/FAD-dependent oxidoreductase [Candidatus Woesearchaeota archaeon]
MKKSKAVSIIGAGPAGCYLAHLLAKKGYKVDVYEEHPVIGKPVQCTGLISKNLAKIIPLGSYVLNDVKGAIMFSKRMKLELMTGKVQAYVVDRTKLDQYIAELARKSGANFYLNHRFLGSKKLNGKKLLRFYHKGKIIERQADIVVGADGPVSRVAKSENMLGKRKFLAGMQARIRGEFDKDHIHMYLGSICPGFFAWFVPESQKYARVGLASGKDTLKLFRSYISKYKEPEFKIAVKQSGAIPLYSHVKTQKKNTYLLGDAAMQVKATTGGGVIMGLLAAKSLSASISTGLPYPLLWKLRIGPNLWLTRLIRKKLNKMSDDDYDELLRIMAKKKNLNWLSTKADMDFPAKFLFSAILLAIREPKLMKFAFR